MRCILLGLLLVTACGTTTRFVATNSSPRPLTPRPPETVTLFAAGLPDRPFVEIGIIQARQSSTLSSDDMPEILDELRAEAGRRGCDGVVINGTNDKQSSTATIFARGSRSSSATLEGFWGTCIMFREPLPMTAANTPRP